MSVRTQHPQYALYSDKWQRCRDVVAGQDAVHAAGVRYLPMLKDQDMVAYRAYVQRAPFFNASARTIDGLSGMLFRLPPKVKVNDAVAEYLKDITLTGDNLNVFALKVALEVLGVGRVGLLVDYPQVDTPNMTQADALTQNLRPSITLYSAETILNWQTRLIKNKTTLSMVVLEEVTAAGAKDEFTPLTEKTYRVLDLDPALNDTYRVRRFRVNQSTGEDEQIGGVVYPKQRGKTLDFLPFYFIGVYGTSWEVSDPPLLDMVDMNLSHYRLSASYEHGLFFTAIPTPVVAGYTPKENEKLYIGSTSAWVFSDASAHASYLEFTGNGLTTVKTALDDKKAEMAVLGARMLEQQKRSVETAEVAAIHRSSEQSLLATIAQTISIAFQAALQAFSDWAGATGEVVFDLNRDFYPIPMSAQTLSGLIMAWLQGGISKQTLFEQLKQGEIISQDLEFEDEEARIRDENPDLTGAGTGAVEPLPAAAPPAQPQTINITIPKGSGTRTVTTPDGKEYVIKEA